MHVFEAWLVYLIVVAVVWLVLSGVNVFGTLSHAGKLFLALLAGALVVFLTTHSIENKCSDDRFWLCLLMLFAYIAPIVIGLWILFKSGWEIAGPADGKVETTYVCEGDDCVHVMSKIHSRSGDTIVYHN